MEGEDVNLRIFYNKNKQVYPETTIILGFLRNYLNN